MDRKTDKTGQGTGAKAEVQTREDRLKAALKANMAKRKAQAKARDTTAHDQEKE